MGLGGKKYFSSLFLSLFRISENEVDFHGIKNRWWNGGKYCREWRRWSRVDSICQRRKIFEEERKEKKRIYFSFSLAQRISVPRDIWIECGGDKSEQFHGERERERTIESFLFHAFQDLEKRGEEKIERLNLSQRFHFGYRVARTEGNSATMLFLPIRLLACPPLFRRGENRRINERRIRRIGAILPPPHETYLSPLLAATLESSPKVPFYLSGERENEAWPICATRIVLFLIPESPIPFNIPSFLTEFFL